MKSIDFLVLALRVAGYKQEEVAELLGVSDARVAQRQGRVMGLVSKEDLAKYQ